MWFESVKSEIQAIKSDNSVKAQVTILETEFKKHVNDFMMIQSMNDANSMQHEEARRMAMKAVKSRLDEIQRKFRLFSKLTFWRPNFDCFKLMKSKVRFLNKFLFFFQTQIQRSNGNCERACLGRSRTSRTPRAQHEGRPVPQVGWGGGGHLHQRQWWKRWC